MRLKIDDKEYEVLLNGTNITESVTMLRILSSDPTEIDQVFSGCTEFFIQNSDIEEYISYANHYNIVYTEVRHNQELGYYQNPETEEYEMRYGDVVTIYLKDKG